MDIPVIGLEGCCAQWQKLLRLQDWEINVSYGRMRELSDTGKTVLGMAEANYEHRYAKFLILHPEDCNEEEREEIEITLVHELLHLYFIPVRGDKTDLVAEEQAINALSSLLVRLTKEKA